MNLCVRDLKSCVRIRFKKIFLTRFKNMTDDKKDENIISSNENEENVEKN